MNYTQSITIELPRPKVVELFDNPDNLKKWQPGLQSFEHLSGEPGTEGAKSELVFEMGKRKMVMIETIIKRNLPEEFHATFETDGVMNIQENYFTETEDGNTRWTSVTEFNFNTLPMKIMGFLMPGVFKKQSLKFMKLFKKFAEDHNNTANLQGKI